MSRDDLTDLGLIGIVIFSAIGFIICRRGMREVL
jgi:hypothetical protein